MTTNAHDRVPLTRPVPTTREHLTDARRCHTPEHHRHTDGERADAASHDRAMRAVTAERDEAYAEITAAWEAINATGRAGMGSIADHIRRLDDARDTAEQAATFRQGVIDSQATELERAREAIQRCWGIVKGVAAERNKLVEAIGRMISLPPEAIATAYDVSYSGGSGEPETSPGSLSPRAQDHDQVAAVAAVAAVETLTGREG